MTSTTPYALGKARPDGVQHRVLLQRRETRLERAGVLVVHRTVGTDTEGALVLHTQGTDAVLASQHAATTATQHG